MTTEAELAPITIVVQRADGHHTVRAATVPEAMAQLHALELALGFKRDTPVLVRQEGADITQIETAALPPHGEWRCPDHPRRKPVQGKAGAYLFCSARLDDGSWCQSRSDRTAAA